MSKYEMLFTMSEKLVELEEAQFEIKEDGSNDPIHKTTQEIKLYGYEFAKQEIINLIYRLGYSINEQQMAYEITKYFENKSLEEKIAEFYLQKVGESLIEISNGQY